MQDVMLTVEAKLHEYLQREWRAHTNIIKYDPSSIEFIKLPDWPLELRGVIGARWNPDKDDFDLTTLGEFVVSDAVLESPLMLVGVPASHKTYTANNVARVFCAQTDKKKILWSGNLDDWGNLSAQGHVADAACSVMDDCEPFTEKGRPLTSTEIVQLFTTRTVSSYGARHHPATFPAGHTKILVFNVDVKLNGTEHDHNTFPNACPWIVESARACIPGRKQYAARIMRTASQLHRAQARRPTVFYFDKSPYTDTDRSQMVVNDEHLMTERLSRMNAHYTTQGQGWIPVNYMSRVLNIKVPPPVWFYPNDKVYFWA
jgi:hypothetical protein